MPDNELADLEVLDLPFDIHSVRQQCIDCVRKQLEKYKNHMDVKKKSTKGRFLVKCAGIPINYLDPKYKDMLSVEDWEMALASVDVVLWAEKNITHPDGTPWIARDYQETVLHCTSKRKALRIARRSGKTDLVSVEITHQLFTKENIRILVTGPLKIHVEEIIDRIRGFIRRNPALAPAVVRDVSSPQYEIELSNGSRVRGFPLGTRGKTEGLSVRGQNADRIYCFPKGTLINTSEFGIKPIERLTLEDTILGGDEDGVRVGRIKNLGTRKATVMTIPTALTVIKCTPEHPLFDGSKDVQAKDAEEAIVSLYYNPMPFSRDVIIARLVGYLYGDGWISNKSVGFSGQEKDLQQIREDLMLLGDNYHEISTRVVENKDLGIKGIVSQFNSNYLYPIFKDCHPCGHKVFQSLRVPKQIMTGKSYIKAAFLSGLFSAEGTGIKYHVNKKSLRAIVLNMRSTKEEWSKNWIADVSSLLNFFGIRHSTKIEFREDLDRYIGHISIRSPKENIQLFIDRIGFCYNAAKTVTLNSYNLFQHYKRTWESERWTKNREVRAINDSSGNIAIKLGLPKSTAKYHKNLYDELYSEPLLLPEEYIEKIRWKGNYVKLSILKENVKYSEELVDVYNITSSASNRFFAGGILTHNCDEMDRADDKAIVGGLLPILQTTPDTTMVGFSTPTGFKSIYYAMCVDDPYYKEFHYDYKVLPHWREVEKDRGAYTEEEWEREFLAEFGAAEEGIYKPSYIDRSLRGYEYREIVPTYGWRYIIGADWNEKHGAELVVVGENISGGYYQVTEAIGIGKMEFTQLSSVNALIQLYKKWNPAYMYVDAGAGCLHANSLVLVPDGVKKISEIKVGDTVLSHKGEFKKVLSAVATGTKKSYSLRPALCLHTIVSSTHKHLVYRSVNRFNDFPKEDILLSEVETKDLNKKTDFFIIPRQDISNPVTSCVIDLAQELSDIPNLQYDDKYIWTKHGYKIDSSISIDNIIKEFNTSRPTVQRTRRKAKSGERVSPCELKLFNQLNEKYGMDWREPILKKVDRYIDICDPEFQYIYGWYLSEGYGGKNSIEICQMPFHYKEEFDQLITSCSKRWDISVHVRKNGLRRLYILNTIISSLFKKIGGSHCENKFIDPRIMASNPCPTLVSIFQGDGHEHKHGLTLSVTSLKLVSQVRQVLVNNGVLPGLHYIKPRKRADGYQDSQPQLMLYMTGMDDSAELINQLLKTKIVSRNGVQRRKHICTDKFFLVPIAKLDYIGESQDMYDLTIDEDNSFCVNGFATHNSTNIELLRKMSQSNKRNASGDLALARIIDILKAYDSGASILTRDPVTGMEKKVPAKPYMVNASVRMFESDKVRISSADKILEKALRNYIIKNISPTGRPVYDMRDKKVLDHRLDAFHLAMVGFFIEFGGLQPIIGGIRPVATVNPVTKRSGSSRQQGVFAKRPENRSLDSDPEGESVLKSLYGATSPARTGSNGIASNRPGWAEDREEFYEEKYLQRRKRRRKVWDRNTIRRSNI